MRNLREQSDGQPVQEAGSLHDGAPHIHEAGSLPMSGGPRSISDREPAAARFAATHWSMVLNAGSGDSPEACAALERLCSVYWFPIYANIRRRGYKPEDASDLTQEFFASLLRRNSLARVGPEKGRFRSFLLTSLGYFLIDHEKHRAAARRRRALLHRTRDRGIAGQVVRPPLGYCADGESDRPAGGGTA